MSSLNVRRAIELFPPMATTGIGSLPHTQQELALQKALQMDIPFLPQLPNGRPSEYMIASALDGLPGLTFDEEGVCTVELEAWKAGQAGLNARIEGSLLERSAASSALEPSAQACRSWKPFLWEVEHRKLPFAKVQVAGPCTVRWVTRTQQGRPASEVPELDQQIFRLLLAKSMAMVQALRRAGATPLVFLDEPGLYAFDRRDARHLVAIQELRVLAMSLQREGALVGVHCCSNTDWAQLLELGLDLLSLDVRLSLDALMEDRAALLRFFQGGSTLSLGIIPTDLASTYAVPELVDSVETALRAVLPPSTSFRAVLARMLLTPACGLAMRSVPDAERIIDEVRGAQRMLRELAQVEPALPEAERPPLH